MAKGTVKNQNITKGRPLSKEQKGGDASILIHVVIGILMILQWCTIIYDMPEANYILKPSVVLTMGFYTLFMNHNGAKAFKQFMVIGFFFSVMGDVFLMFDGMNYFMYGLVSFATAHIAFLIGFFENSSFDTNLFVNFSAPLGVILAGYAFFMYTYLTHQVGFPADMKTPVLVYCILISTMALAASMRDKTSKKSYLIGFIGALFFISSDSILSFSIFVPGYNAKIFKFLIMFTYYISEELIFIAALDHFKYFKTRDHEKLE